MTTKELKKLTEQLNKVLDLVEDDDNAIPEVYIPASLEIMKVIKERISNADILQNVYVTELCLNEMIEDKDLDEAPCYLTYNLLFIEVLLNELIQ